MDIQAIPLISVSYNSAELIEDLLSSFRLHYANPVTIIDGSSAEHVPAIEAVCAKYPNVKFLHFDYNIHHGPGMAWAYQNLDLQGPVLVLDSDVYVLNPGLIEALAAALKPGMYGVGYVNHVNEGGFDVTYEDGAVRYLHPACMLCNIEVVRQWPMPTKHGAPNIEPMLAIHRAGRHDLIAGISWVKDDFSQTFEPKHYLRHDWQGTVTRTGGYHLEEWQKAEAEKSKVLQIALSLIPSAQSAVVQISGGEFPLARAYKAVHSACNCTSMKIRDDKIENDEVACRDEVIADIEHLTDEFFRTWAKTDCWILDQVLERMARPEELLVGIRKVIQSNGCIVAIIPNAQHWSVQAKLCIGDFRYADAGLMHKSHLRWFTRATLFELFQNAGFAIAQGYPVIHHRMENAMLAAALRQLSISVGADPELAFEDAQPIQYVVRAVPI
jgi:hypothetical protein